MVAPGGDFSGLLALHFTTLHRRNVNMQFTSFLKNFLPSLDCFLWLCFVVRDPIMLLVTGQAHVLGMFGLLLRQIGCGRMISVESLLCRERALQRILSRFYDICD